MHASFSHLKGDVQLSSFHILTFMTNSVMNIRFCMDICFKISSVPWRVELLSHIVVLFSLLWGMIKLSSRAATLFSFHINNIWGFLYPCTIGKFSICLLTVSMQMFDCYLIVVLIYILWWLRTRSIFYYAHLETWISSREIFYDHLPILV